MLNPSDDRDTHFNVYRTLDVRSSFNPVDCLSLGMIKRELRGMPAMSVLVVLANRFQQREIQAWCGKLRHRILSQEDDVANNDLVMMYIENSVSK